MISVTLSANAGVSLSIGGKKIWIDALHDTQVPGFSTVDPALQEQMERHEMFRRPDVIFCSHCHLDHYSRALVQKAVERWPEAKLVLPQPEFPGQVLMTGPLMEETIGGVDFRFFALPHEEGVGEKVPHYGALICAGGACVLVTGDCEMASPVLAQRIQGIRIDLALIDFPWVTLRRGREFIQRSIAPRHLLVCHLPFSQDDCYGYREAAERSARLLELPDVRLLTQPLQTERF